MSYISSGCPQISKVEAIIQSLRTSTNSLTNVVNRDRTFFCSPMMPMQLTKRWNSICISIGTGSIARDEEVKKPHLCIILRPPTPKDEVIAILGTFEIAMACAAVVRGVSSFGELIHSQVMDSCREKGRKFVSRRVPEDFASEQDRRKSDKILEETLEKRRARTRGSLEP